jgi:hypothetical protein
MASEDDRELSVLDVLRDVTVSDRAFFNIVRYLDNGTRNQLIAAYLRNTHTMVNLLRFIQQQEGNPRMIVTIPMSDPSGNFLDPVPVVATPEQIQAGTENHVNLGPDVVCSICQDPVACATRIRACGHCFHPQCIAQWFTMNTRCPMCRHDVRDLRVEPGE